MSRRGVTRLAIVTLLTLAALAGAPAYAQSCGGLRGGVGNVQVALVNAGCASFDPNGPFSLSMPDIHLGGSSSARVQFVHPIQPGPPLPPPEIDLNQIAAELFRTRASRCLTGAESAPCEPAVAPPGAINVRSTEPSITWLFNQIGGRALRDAPLPGIVIQTNPTIGLAQVDSWFWVDRTTYDGQPFVHTAQVYAPWALDWDEVIHHHDAVHGPCPGDPAQACVIGFHDWDEVVHQHQDHVDVATASVTLTPAHYSWDFGDDVDGPPRSDSHLQFAGTVDGIGSPYAGPFSPSPVSHKYRESSRLVFDQGGFNVHLQVRWTAQATISVTRDGALIQSGTGMIGERVGEYRTLVQVRESQPVVVASR